MAPKMVRKTLAVDTPVTLLYYIFVSYFISTIFEDQLAFSQKSVLSACFLILMSLMSSLSIHVIDSMISLQETNICFLFLGPKVLPLHLVLQCTAKHWMLVCNRLWDLPRTICHSWHMELQWLLSIIISNKENGKKSKDSKGN